MTYTYAQLELFVAVLAAFVDALEQTAPKERDLKAIDDWFARIMTMCMAQYDVSINIDDVNMQKIGKLRSRLSKCRNEAIRAHR